MIMIIWLVDIGIISYASKSIFHYSSPCSRVCMNAIFPVDEVVVIHFSAL